MRSTYPLFSRQCRRLLYRITPVETATMPYQFYSLWKNVSEFNEMCQNWGGWAVFHELHHSRIEPSPFTSGMAQLSLCLSGCLSITRTRFLWFHFSLLFRE